MGNGAGSARGLAHGVSGHAARGLAGGALGEEHLVDHVLLSVRVHNQSLLF